METMKAIKSTLRAQLVNSFARSMMKFIVFIEPIFSTILLYVVYSQKAAYDSAYYIIVGSSIFALWGNICFSSAGDIERERFMGNLEILSASPVGLKVIALGKILANNLLGIASIIITYLFATVILEVRFIPKNPGMFIGAIILSSYALIGIALFMMASFTVSRNARGIMNGIDMPICFLSGFFFPIEILPKFLQYLSYLLPSTWAMKLLKITSVGTKGNDFQLSTIIFVLIILSTVYIIAGLRLFDLADKKSRQYASLGVH